MRKTSVLFIKQGNWLAPQRIDTDLILNNQPKHRNIVVYKWNQMNKKHHFLLITQQTFFTFNQNNKKWDRFIEVVGKFLVAA